MLKEIVEKSEKNIIGPKETIRLLYVFAQNYNNIFLLTRNKSYGIGSTSEEFYRLSFWAHKSTLNLTLGISFQLLEEIARQFVSSMGKKNIVLLFHTYVKLLPHLKIKIFIWFLLLLCFRYQYRGCIPLRKIFIFVSHAKSVIYSKCAFKNMYISDRQTSIYSLRKLTSNQKNS